MSIKIDQYHYHPIKTQNLSKTQRDFKQFLHDELINPELKISKHAQERLVERHINLTNDEWSLIQEKISEARKKGVQDSLVLVSEAALIINAKSNTVITAMDREEAKTQMFTNINGAIIMD